jgi:hypothetical protein
MGRRKVIGFGKEFMLAQEQRESDSLTGRSWTINIPMSSLGYFKTRKGAERALKRFETRYPLR